MSREEIDILISEASHSYPIIVESGLLDNGTIAKGCELLGRRLAIIGDTTVISLYGQKLLNHLCSHGIAASLFPFPPGEASKNRTVKADIEDAMAMEGFCRDSAVLAIGGGVSCDMAAFIASTYCRGIPLIMAPTTLLAMVDAAIGGKTAIDLPIAKNFIGTFYHPAAIYIDIDTLETLDISERRHGAAEMIKHGLIASKTHYSALERAIPPYIQGVASLPTELLITNMRIKIDIITADTQEVGLRRALNFGHTFAHAIEQVSGYSIPHGDAVIAGMVLESYCSYAIGSLAREELERIAAFLSPYCQLVSQHIALCKSEELWHAMTMDKKALSRQPRIVLLEAIGRVNSSEGEWCAPLPYSLFLEALAHSRLSPSYSYS